MSVSQSDERIEADINEIVQSLFPEDATTTTEAPLRRDSQGKSDILNLGAQTIFWLLVLVLAVGVLYLLFKVIRKGPSRPVASKASKRPDSRRRKTSNTAKAPLVDEGSDAGNQGLAESPKQRLPRAVEQWLSEALVAHDDGNFREAVRCRYRASVALLAYRGLLSEDETSTVGEYLLEVHRSAPKDIRVFASAAQIFERAWYSDRAIEREHSSDMERLFDEIQMATR